MVAGGDLAGEVWPGNCRPRVEVDIIEVDLGYVDISKVEVEVGESEGADEGLIWEEWEETDQDEARE